MECESVRINASSFADSVSMGAPISGMRYFFRFFLLEAFINNWLNIDCIDKLLDGVYIVALNSRTII